MPPEDRVAHVAPLLRLPRSIGVFDYLLPHHLEVQRGGIVRVPFRTRRTAGVILGQSRDTQVRGKLLPVEAVVSREPLLPEPQLRAAAFVAEEGFTSIATTLRSILPSLPLSSRLVLQSPEQRRPTPAAFADAVSGELGDHRALVVPYLWQATKLRFYRTLLKSVQHAGGSALLITPTVNRAKELAEDLHNATVLTRSGSDRIDRELFLDLRSRPSSIVIGTRSAIFAPVQNLWLIVIDDEDADEHLQEEPSPRYDSRRVAEFLSRLTGARLILTSRLPSLVTACRYPLAHPIDEPPAISIRFINLDEARRAGDYGLLTEAARHAMADVADRGGNLAVIHHRRSVFASLICQDCGYVPTCETCRVPLPSEGTTLVCRHCGRTTEVPLQCPRCQGVSLRGRGRGLTHLLREVQELKRRRRTGASQHNDGSFTVGTWGDLESLRPATYDLVVVTRYDSLLSLPRADAAERSRRLLRALASRLKPSAGTLLVQGSRAFEATVRDLFRNPSRDAELEIRKRFGYPPAWRLTLLRRRGQPRSASVAPRELVSRLKAADPTLLVTGPLPSLGRSRRDPLGDIILLRSRGTLSPPVRRILKHLDEGWTIAIDPREIR